jgi:hypothetical protein
MKWRGEVNELKSSIRSKFKFCGSSLYSPFAEKLYPREFLLVIFDVMSESQRVSVNKILNCNQYVRIDMMLLISIVVSISFIYSFFHTHYIIHTWLIICLFFHFFLSLDLDLIQLYAY